MSTVTFSSTDTTAEVRVLAAALQHFLSEQPEQPLRAGKADFTYDANGALSMVNVVLDGE